MALAPERGPGAVAKAGDKFAVLAEADGYSPVDAAVFAPGMRHRIRDAIRAIEVSGGGVGGRG
jgi:hypothetical protein